jgi:hypothetical protein
MKTDDLIEMLSTDVDAVDTSKVKRQISTAILLGAGVAFASSLLAFGVRADVRDPSAVKFLMLKLVFGAAVVALGSTLLIKYVRPGGEFRTWIGLATIPFLAAVVLAGFNLLSASASHWDEMLLGDQWLQCLISIPIIAVLPFVLIIGAIRLAAPTNLVRTGALAGLISGGLSALGYALHCADDSLPFVALWYGGTIALCTTAGALLGRRLLRW